MERTPGLGHVAVTGANGHLGRRLLARLVEIAAERGMHVMIAGIEAENAASIRLHEALGFRHVGRFEEVGIKFGRWLDLACMELRLVSPDRS